MSHGFSRFWIEIQLVRKSGLLEPFFCLLRLWQWGATLGYEFSRFWIEIQFVRKNGLLEPFFCLFRLWQGGGPLWGMNFRGFGSRFNSLGKTASWSHSFVFFGSGKGGALWAMNFRRFGSRFNSLGKTASWSHSFVFFGSGKGDYSGP